MIRLTNIQLPLDHDDHALINAVLARLSINADELLSHHIHRRGYDARKKTNIVLVYTLDVATTHDEALLEKFAGDQLIKATPDMRYKYVAQAPADLEERPVIIGFGPCGLLAGLVLAQMGYKPIILDRGKEVRERTKDTFGFWRKKYSTPNPTYSLAKAAQVPSLTASSIAR